jgi:DNA primase
MPEGDDPDSLIRGQGPNAFRERIEAQRLSSISGSIVRRVRPEFASPRGRVAAARKLAGAISLISDAVLRGDRDEQGGDAAGEFHRKNLRGC